MSHTALTDRPVTVAAQGTATAPQAARLDLYAPIHKALRGFMVDTLMRVGAIDVADEAHLAAGLAQLGALLDACTSHLRRENEFVHTLIEARQPAGSQRIADEHVEHLESIAALRDEARALQAAAPERRMPLALRLYRHLALFVAENFQHMHIEETVHNAALWAHYTDAELVDMHHRLLASIEPQESLLLARWMIPLVGPADRAAIVGEMKAGMPPEALLGVLGHVRPHLDDGAWMKLSNAVGVAPDLGRASAG